MQWMLTGYNEWLIGYSSELNTVDHRHTQWTHKAQYTVIHLHTKYIESAPGLTSKHIAIRVACSIPVYT